MQGLIDPGRAFDRIIFVTSRFAKAKERAQLEDELSGKAGISRANSDSSARS